MPDDNGETHDEKCTQVKDWYCRGCGAMMCDCQHCDCDPEALELVGK